MVSLVRHPKTGAWKSRKVIPEDIREAYGKANETPTWSATLTPSQAKATWSRWLAEVEAKIDRLRQIKRAVPVSLTHREVQALAGEWYQEQVRTWEDDPGDPRGWEAALDEIEYEDEEAAERAYHRGEPYEGPIKRLPHLEGQLDALLERRTLVLEAGARDAVLEAMHGLYAGLCSLLERRARGDYSADVTPSTFPNWERTGTTAKETPTVSITSLFERYAAERKPAASSLKSYRQKVRDLITFLGHEDAARVTGENIVAWKDSLLGERGLAAKSVRDTYLAMAKTLFAYGVENRMLKENPAAGITVRGPRRVTLRDPGLTDAEAETILRATLTPPARLSSERRLAVRWIPWVCAYTGARVNEITQLRREDVFQEDGVAVLRITPEAGSTKTGKARVVPIHSHLIEQGFLKAVESAKAGPLFYDPKRHRGGTEGNPQSKKVGEALARWVRGLGVTDKDVAPNHGWRHRFKTVMRTAGVDHEAREVIMGHALGTEGAAYGHWSATALKREIEKVARYLDTAAAKAGAD